MLATVINSKSSLCGHTGNVVESDRSAVWLMFPTNPLNLTKNRKMKFFRTEVELKNESS